MQFVDSHCHIHSADYPLDAEKVYRNALKTGVTRLICVGEDVDDSKLAAGWALGHENSWASVGVHPHEAKKGIGGIETLLKNKQLAPKIMALGEIGLDYHYMHSSRNQQIKVLEAQLHLAHTYTLPVIFHIREAYDDFWPILAQFPQIQGVLHSFTDTDTTFERALKAELYIGVNGIATFTKDPHQQAMYKNIPLDHLLLETDAPYLTPAPLRGKMNVPAYVRLVAQWLAMACALPIEEIALCTSENASRLFNI
jgi:TatD DNase family protein